VDAEADPGERGGPWPDLDAADSGQPDEAAPSTIVLAGESDSACIDGQTLHPNGGTVVNG
jgi:hypothetical protein